MDLENDIVFQEWKQCRASIAHFDEMILAVRKYGFGLVTLLISADGFLAAELRLEPPLVIGVYAALLALIYGLFRVDRYHEIFLRAAVARAIDLERKRDLQLSTDITCYSELGRTGTWGLWLYVIFCAAALLLAVAAMLSDSNGSTPLSNLPGLPALAAGVLFLLVVGLIFWHDRDTRRIARSPCLPEPPQGTC